MEKDELNYEWINEQLAEAKVRVSVGKAVIKLLEEWQTITLNPEQSKQALDIFSSLALGHSIVTIVKDEIWVDARPGSLKVGDTVRVMRDAFDGSTGVIHNGRRGVITAIRSGDIIINSTDGRTPKLEGAHYAPYKLQKRVQ